MDQKDYKALLATKGLYQGASWPTDHADNKRSKFFPGGLKYDPSRPVDEQIGVLRTKDERIFDPQWMYTREKDQLYIYGGRAYRRFLARLNVQTMDLEQIFYLPYTMYQGGAIMHENGDVYCITANIFFRFKGGDLTKVERIVLPHLNGNSFTISNGLLVLENGLIVIKLWGFNFWDLFRLFVYLFDYMVKPGLALALIFLAELLFLGASYVIPSLLNFLLLLMVTIPIVMILWDELVPFHISTGFTFRDFFKIQPGRFILLDPETLKIVYQHDFPDKCTYARLCISPKKDNKQEIIVLGDHVVQKYVFNYEDGTCVFDRDSEKFYRQPGDWSTRGTGPTMVERDVFFTNNTFPEILYCDNYQIYKFNLDDHSVFKSYDLTPKGTKGFMWWSVVSNPHINSVLVWDSLGSKVFCFDRDLNLVWTCNKNENGKCVPISIHNNDCLVCSPKTQHVYVSHMTEPFRSIKDVMRLQVWGSAMKYLVVLDTATGSELFRIKLSEDNFSSRACNIIIGNNDDVFVGLPNGVARVYSKSS